MPKQLMLFLYIALCSNLAFSQYCKDYKRKPLRIGCTYQCNYWVRGALVKAARKLNTHIEIINLINNKHVKMDSLDAIIIPGGADISSEYYIHKLDQKWKEITERYRHLTEVTTQSNIRDPFEYNFLTDYFKNPKLKYTPILGICRGMQMLTVSQGIPLYQDIKEELGISNRRYKIDKVYVTDFNSKIYEVQKRKKFLAVELHHQGLRMDYWLENSKKHPELKVTAVSNNKKIVEAIEFKNRPILGVQFHPETTFGKTRSRIFKWLLQEACYKREQK